MTYYDAYIADADDSGEPLRGEGHVTSPMFPPEGYGKAFFAICKGVESGRFRGVQVDWGSWAARMTRTEIERFIDEIYGPPGDYEARHAGGLQHLADEMRTLRAFVANLPADGKLAVVCEEF